MKTSGQMLSGFLAKLLPLVPLGSAGWRWMGTQARVEIHRTSWAGTEVGESMWLA